MYVTNCTFTTNSSTNSPAVLGGVNYTIYNSIFWGNNNTFGTLADLNAAFGEVYNSIVENGWTGTGSSNLNANPLFIYPPNLEYAPLEIGNLRLQTCSPAIDAGDNAAPDLVGITTDLDENDRIYVGTPGTVAVVDMGAYELQEDIMPATAIICYRNLDSDTYGNPLDSAFFCTTCDTGYVSDNTDCNDDPQNGGATAFPGNTEICFDFIDNDCNGLIDETCCPTDTILYVNQAATGNNTGSDWANAFTDLQTALSFTKFADCNISQIWVAEGTYYPSLDKEGSIPIKNPRSITFFIDFNIEIYGGFKGTESMLDERNWLSNPTILSGDIGVLEDSTDNVFNIICSEGFGTEIILDGFEVTRGNANSEDFSNTEGAAWYNSNATVSVKNCTFKNNTATNNGGAIHSREANFHTINCTFYDNHSSNNGGAIYFEYDFNPTALSSTNCAFWNNDSRSGGGIYLRHFGFPQSDTSLYVTNCSFSGNTAEVAGAGGAIFFDDNFAFASIKNSILWGNSFDEVDFSTNSVAVYNSIIEGGFGSAMDTVPFFVSPPNNLRLQAASPAIDIGTNTFNMTSTDLDELPRITNSTIDLGAYEYFDSQVICYRDLDGDTFGDSTVTQLFFGSCGTGYVLDNTDCNDDPNNGGAVAFPSNPEIMGDGIDNDCDGIIDENDIICEEENLFLTTDINTVQEYNAAQTLQAINTIFSPNADVTYTAGQSIILSPEFEVIEGATFHAYIADCDLQGSENLENRSLDVETALTLDIYPNPLSHTAQIRFYLPKPGRVNISIFDLNGQIFKTWETVSLEASWHQQSLEVNQLPSGIYWLRLQTAEAILTRKFSVVKE